MVISTDSLMASAITGTLTNRKTWNKPGASVWSKTLIFSGQGFGRKAVKLEQLKNFVGVATS